MSLDGTQSACAPIEAEINGLPLSVISTEFELYPKAV
jgi:hypothetical protein